MQKIFLLFFSFPLFLSAQIQTSTKSRAQILLEQHDQAIMEAQFPEEFSIEPGGPISWGMEEETAIEELEPDPQPTEEELERQRKADRLNRMFNNNNKGHVVEDPLSPYRTGNGGIGNSGDYYLAGRDPRNLPKPINDCNQEGVVVVKIRVDANGKVVETTGGVNIPNGPSSNFGTSTCLVDRAERAARKTTWTPKSGAGLQIGYIVYRFELK